MESISNRKTTSLGKGYFLTWVTTYTTGGDEVVGRQLFRIFKFDPSTIGAQYRTICPGRNFWSSFKGCHQFTPASTAL